MGGKSTQTTKRTPYDPAAVASANKALSGAYGQSQAIQQQFTPSINAALAKIGQNVTTPPQYAIDARTQLGKTINGDYVNANPYTGGIADLIAKKAQGNYAATFGASGRSRGGLAALLSGQGVGDALQSFYSGVYDQERGRQQQAIGMAPAFNADEYTGTNALLGGVNAASMMPLNAANAYGGGVTQVNAPYATDTTTTKQSMGLGQILGMAAQIGSAFIPGVGLAKAPANGVGGMAGLLGAPNKIGGSLSNIPIDANTMRFLG